jgi:putative pyruvate formate lyase activating enzyme
MQTASLYTNCRLCPRDCGVDRASSPAKAHCGEGIDLRLAFAGLHRGEEPPLSGEGGSGTVFVSGCNLGCDFCQNWQISKGGLGRVVSTEEFAAICMGLERRGAENINIVTGSHAVPAIAGGLRAAKDLGLGIPVLWNSSAYERPQTLELLDGLVDTWLPDLKTLDFSLAARFFHAPDYPRIATEAIRWMINNRPRGVIVRHLVLPGHLEATREVLRWFADNALGNAALSLMSQYTPMPASAGQRLEQPERFVSRGEYETVLGWLGEFGIEDGFCQELVTGSDWLPDFNRPNPFSSELSVPVWHFGENIVH